MMTKPICVAGMKLIRDFEGERLESYRCSAGKWTISIGVTGPHVGPGMKITQAESDRMFAEALARFAQGVDRLIKVKVTENQRAALTSLAYNIGLNAFAKSSLLKALNAGRFSEAAERFGQWVHAGGALTPGLVRRRAAERTLFETPDGPRR